MRKLIYILIFPLLITISGCSGCSESGIRHQASKDYSQVEDDFKENRGEQSFSKKSSSVHKNTESTNNSLSSLFNKYRSAVFVVYTSDNKEVFQGSGFFIDPNGLAISNYHVFEGTQKGNEAIVTDSEQELKVSNVLAKSREDDYIIFKVNTTGQNNYLSLSKEEPEIGEEVFAIGNPRGLEHTLSTGIISGYRDKKHLLQTTTEITHGSSGGPLLNMKGEVVGITTGGLGEANLNFAVNIKKLRLGSFLN